VSDNDNQKPPVVLDEHRGMAAQKATDARRHQSGVETDQEVLRKNRADLEKILFAGPAATWPQAAEKAIYLLRLFGETAEGQDPRHKQLIEDVCEDFRRLTEPPVF
jgi:hypothetical protein